MRRRLMVKLFKHWIFHLSTGKIIRLIGAVTGLKHRHSMGLKCFLHLPEQFFPDKLRGLFLVIVQGDGQDLLNLGGI